LAASASCLIAQRRPVRRPRCPSIIYLDDNEPVRGGG
jgi:hypothetical protein